MLNYEVCQRTEVLSRFSLSPYNPCSSYLSHRAPSPLLVTVCPVVSTQSSCCRSCGEYESFERLITKKNIYIYIHDMMYKIEQLTNPKFLRLFSVGLFTRMLILPSLVICSLFISVSIPSACNVFKYILDSVRYRLGFPVFYNHADPTRHLSLFCWFYFAFFSIKTSNSLCAIFLCLCRSF
jgi:hypothetical protein